HGCRASVGGQEALSTDPRQNRGAQEAAVIEPPFLWILSFGGAKESISPSGAITRLTNRRDSDLIMCVF
ncbi:MAG: hypothetical protein D0531_01740, partial [Methylococcales bacterium]